MLGGPWTMPSASGAVSSRNTSWGFEPYISHTSWHDSKSRVGATRVSFCVEYIDVKYDFKGIYSGFMLRLRKPSPIRYPSEACEPGRHSWTKCPPSAMSFAKSPHRMRTGNSGRLDSAGARVDSCWSQSLPNHAKPMNLLRVSYSCMW
jgi:hypothetical protein